ncbi:MAG: hypothetical protein HC897_00870 [Thermoanaerobaculia bacterium]|nr:hypothetical protein [Thermoanaerobaculia bacterium]
MGLGPAAGRAAGSGRKPGTLIGDQLELLGAAFLRFGDRRDQLDPAAALDDALSRLPGRVELPMAARILVGRVEDRVFEEGVFHVDNFPRDRAQRLLRLSAGSGSPGSAREPWVDGRRVYLGWAVARAGFVEANKPPAGT